MLPELSHDEIHRYSRHLLIPDVGLEGQQKLKAASVLVIGTGGLGSPVALYLAAAGVGRIGLVDYDVVDFSNLQRQIIHDESRLGDLKVESARDRLKDLNSEIQIDIYNEYITFVKNALDVNEEILLKLDALLLELSSFDSFDAGEIENMKEIKDMDQLIKKSKLYY